MKEVRNINSYLIDKTDISKSYLLELFASIGEYREELVLIGGWAPYFILDQNLVGKTEFKHIGSIDIDLAVNPELIETSPDKYKLLIEYLEDLGYENKHSRTKENVPASFVKTVKDNLEIQIDLLTSLNVNLGKAHRHLKIQPELLARRTKGIDIVFDHNFKYILSGNLPDGGGETKIEIRIANILSMIIMKGFVLDQRLDGKDAYDIYALVKYYKKGYKSVALEIKEYKDNELIQESIRIISEKFEKRSSVGPKQVGKFMYPEQISKELREQTITDAWMNVNEFIKMLK
ncbi:hypothetical protein KAU33_03290 [Candidatus Dependentiae bacterium]|nr:hypothetical protein [Candidatus Dependentiae bacterium]